MAKMKNATGGVVRFRIDGDPGQSRQYEVAPGDTCDIPDGYVKSGLVKKFAPGLVPASEASVAKAEGQDKGRRRG